MTDETGDGIQLGSRVNYTINNFKGIATSRTIFLNGCIRVEVAPEELKDGQPQRKQFFDEQQLETIEANVIVSREPHAISITNGDRVKHKFTPFSGIVTAITTEINGIVMMGVQSETLHEGKPIPEQGFYAHDLELVVQLPVKTSKESAAERGGPRPDSYIENRA